MMANRLAMFIDTSKCMACRGCQVACKQWNDLPAYQTENRGSYENPPTLGHYTYTRIRFNEHDDGERFQWLFLKEGCMHCADAACVDVCPTGALKHGPYGIVTYERELCNGCGYCSQFCPFGVPHLNAPSIAAGTPDLMSVTGMDESTSGLAGLTGSAKSAKCTFCKDKIEAGTGGPSCAEACPTGALTWGERGTLLAQAKTRVSELKSGDHKSALLYGEHEAGGLHRLSILLDQPAAYGLPEDPGGQFILARLWRKVIQPAGFAIFGVALVGVTTAYGLARRNIHMEEVE